MPSGSWRSDQWLCCQIIDRADLFADSQFLGRLINKTCTTRAFLTLSSGCSPSRGHGWYLSEYFQYLRHIKAPLGLFPICWFTKHSPHRLHPSLGPWYTASLLCCLSATFSLQFLAFLAVRSLVNNILCKLVQYLIRVKDDIWRQWPQIINTCIFVTEGERGQKRVEGRGVCAPPAPWHRKFFGSRGRTSLGPGQPHSSLTLPCRGRWTQCCRLFLRRCTEVSCADPRFPAPDKMSRQLSPDFTKSKTGLTTSREYLRWWEER